MRRLRFVKRGIEVWALVRSPFGDARVIGSTATTLAVKSPGRATHHPERGRG